MFDLGWSELLVIGIVALIVVGPKDLPGMFRTLGRFTAKAKNMAREFQRAMDDAADESGFKDATKDLRDMTNPRKMGLDKVKEAADRFEKWEPDFSSSKKGPATQALSEERAQAAEKTRETAAKKAASGKTAAKDAKTAGAQASETASGKTTAKSSTGNKTATRKTPPKKTTAAKPAAKKTGTTKTTAKPATKKTAAKTASRKPAAKKTESKTAAGSSGSGGAATGKSDA